jgi:hypothetical protein
MELTVVIENFFHSRAVADPVKHSAPEMLFVGGNTPTTTSGFADKGMNMTFLFSAFDVLVQCICESQNGQGANERL